MPGAGTLLPAITAEGRLDALFAEAESYPATESVEALSLGLCGIAGTRHHGFTRKAGPREPWYRRGMEMRSGRQVSAVSAEDLAAIAAKLGLDGILPEWLGANLFVSGLADFSWLPAGTRLHFAEASLVVEAQNAPCAIVGREIARQTGMEVATKFAPAAKGLRGLVLSVERAGSIRAGETFKARLPVQRLWHG